MTIERGSEKPLKRSSLSYGNSSHNDTATDQLWPQYATLRPEDVRVARLAVQDSVQPSYVRTPDWLHSLGLSMGRTESIADFLASSDRLPVDDLEEDVFEETAGTDIPQASGLKNGQTSSSPSENFSSSWPSSRSDALSQMHDNNQGNSHRDQQQVAEAHDLETFEGQPKERHICQSSRNGAGNEDKPVLPLDAPLEFSAALEREVAHFEMADRMIEELQVLACDRELEREMGTRDRRRLWKPDGESLSDGELTLSNGTSVRRKIRTHKRTRSGGVGSPHRISGDGQETSSQPLDAFLPPNAPGPMTSGPQMLASSLLVQAGLTNREVDRLPSDLVQLVKPSSCVTESASKVSFRIPSSASMGDMRATAPPKDPCFLSMGRKISFCSFDSSFLYGAEDRDAPRPELIIEIVPKYKRPDVLKSQNNLCAGCGVHIENQYLKRLRFCEYYGRFFCCACHSNTLMLVPGWVLGYWAFTMFPVSNYAHDFLDRIHNQTIFDVKDKGSDLLSRQRVLREVQDLRTQCKHLLPFMETCRKSASQLATLRSLPEHWMQTNSRFSMHDFALVKEGRMAEDLRRAVSQCIEHVTLCPLCQAKGFICEVCRNLDDVLFPFELRRSTQCEICLACFHRACFLDPGNCPRCQRRRMREAALLGADFEREVRHGVQIMTGC